MNADHKLQDRPALYHRTPDAEIVDGSALPGGFRLQKHYSVQLGQARRGAGELVKRL
jgi:hypothetical protein